MDGFVCSGVSLRGNAGLEDHSSTNNSLQLFLKRKKKLIELN